jgi:cob(I)alamin adenosyltransferase
LTEEISSRSKRTPEELKEGLVQIFTGDGRGKTTAALGTVMRALGHGLKVCVVVFMKGNYPYNEWKFLSKEQGVKIARFGSGTFTDPNNVKPEEIEQAKQALSFAREAVSNGNYNLVVLDELNLAVGWNLVDLDEVIRLIQEKPDNVELILTGRMAHKRLVELADQVTECLNIKHPFDKGILARPGIDY